VQGKKAKEGNDEECKDRRGRRPVNVRLIAKGTKKKGGAVSLSDLLRLGSSNWQVILVSYQVLLEVLSVEVSTSLIAWAFEWVLREVASSLKRMT